MDCDGSIVLKVHPFGRRREGRRVQDPYVSCWRRNVVFEERWASNDTERLLRLQLHRGLGPEKSTQSDVLCPRIKRASLLFLR
jgi:hypothetical protein